MSARPRVPRLAGWLAGISVPAADRTAVLGDLEERFARRVEVDGVRTARRWYRTQALGLVLRVGSLRLLHSLPRAVAAGTGRTAIRSLLRSPGSSLAAAATLAAGVAAPVAMFALADGTTRALPGDPDDRVVRVSRVDRGGAVAMGFPWAVVEAWTEGAVGPGHALAELAAFRSGGPMAVAGGNAAATRERGVYATSAVFRLLEVAPVVGRLYGDDDEGGPPPVVIRDDLWDERFGRDPGALGQRLRIDGVDHVVVGVLPRGFGFPVDHRLWMQRRGGGGEAWSVVGRLGAGASAMVAREQLAGVAARAAPDLGTGEEGMPPTLRVDRYTEAHFSHAREPEHTRRIGLVSLILVVLAAVNVAAVMIARGVARDRETAVRMALGARRSQIMALTLAEGALLAVAGGVVGLALGHAVLKLMVRYLTGQAVIVPYWMDFGLGSRSIMLAGLLALLALAVAGLFPALRASRTEPDRVLRLRPFGGPGGAARAMSLVVGLEVALSAFLLAVSSVVVDEALARLRTGADFDTEGLLTGHFVLEPPDHPDVDARRAFLSRLLDALRADPSVLSASLTSALPGKEGLRLPAGLAGPDPSPEGRPPAQVRSIEPGFLPLLGVSESSGRLFPDADAAPDEPVAVVNQAFVRRHDMVAGEMPGKRIVVGLTPDSAWVVTVVGVARDRGVTPHTAGEPAPGVYLPIGQLTLPAVYLVVRTRDGTSLPRLWRRAVTPLDPYLPLGDVLTLRETLRRGHGAATLFMSVFLALGAVTLLVALVGLYGVHSFSLARRFREIGLRRALGARRGVVLRESVGRGLRPVWAGLILGTVPGFVVAGAVVPVEPGGLTYAVAPVVLLATSVLALWSPARGASHADPAETLREG